MLQEKYMKYQRKTNKNNVGQLITLDSPWAYLEVNKKWVTDIQNDIITILELAAASI
jgi:hypothetical protein